MCDWKVERCPTCEKIASSELKTVCDTGTYHEPDERGGITEGMEVEIIDMDCGCHGEEPELSGGESAYSGSSGSVKTT
jgi:hypothetical protein